MKKKIVFFVESSMKEKSIFKKLYSRIVCILGIGKKKPAVIHFQGLYLCTDKDSLVKKLKNISSNKFKEHINQYGKYKDETSSMKILILGSLIVNDNSLLCENCMSKEEKLKYKVAFKKDYPYLFDTGVCEKCKNTNEVLYMPLAQMHLLNSEFSIMDWYDKFPRNKEHIEAMVSEKIAKY